VSVGLWADDGDAYLIHDYHQYNPPAEQVREERRVRNEKKVAAGRAGARARWQTDSTGDGTSNGTTDGKPIAGGMAEGMPMQCQTDGPVPVPVPPVLTSLSSLTGGAANVGDEERIEAALKTLTRRDYEANADQVKNRAAWIKTAMQTNRAAFATELAELAGEHPDWPAEQLADTVAPSPHEAFYDGVVREI
jgi:hypothetical protein